MVTMVRDRAISSGELVEAHLRQIVDAQDPFSVPAPLAAPASRTARIGVWEQFY